ncbi:MAG: glycoside hydrolase family 18 protein [Cytophagaceae bacterium]|nr:glycoside hydrolase family 18 protein [Cytophagaceae bacterium]
MKTRNTLKPLPKTILVLSLILAFVLPGLAQTQKEIIGYYPSWQWYKRSQLMSPEKLDYSKYTILNYSFFAPDAEGNLFGTDAWADSVLLRGKIDWAKAQPAYFPNTGLVDIAHAWGVKVMVSIGGWTLSENFPSIAADPVKRAHFASQCVHLLRSYKFDGIDIDWEYPGYAEHKGGTADKANFTLLMQAIRDSIDNYGQKINYKFLLTGAFGANIPNMENIEWEKIKVIMDYINLMTYDFNGPWSEETNHNSPLYSPAKGGVGSYDYAFKLLTEKYGVPSAKINMGVAFYGRTFVDCAGGKADVYAKHSGQVDAKTFAVDEGMPQYFNIVYQMDKFTKGWDSTAQVPYLVGKDINTFVTYDDEQSIRLKAEYVVQKNAAGVIIWDVTGDYMEKSPGSGSLKGTPLANVLNEVFKNGPKKAIKKRWK